jgi:polysaccharide pyruvyl transferase WcaK-like protein
MKEFTGMNIVIFDTAIGSGNLGDQIIMEAVNTEISNLFPDAFIYQVPTHSEIGRYGRKLARQADLVFAGGTNLLFSHWSHSRQWKLDFADLAAIGRKLILMGTGWTDYQSPPDWRARYAYRRLLSPHAMHSLRDSYSVAHLKTCGFRHVANTGCPTLWKLGSPGAPSNGKAATVIATLTDYRQAPEHDRTLLALLKTNYKRVLVWLQGSGDLDYLRQLDIPGWEPINPSLKAYDAALSEGSPVDYVGTRLHAGIRAMQKGRRALILSVDNRAREMGRDFDLPVVERGDMAAIEHYLSAWPEPAVKLPVGTIAAWRGQFAANESKLDRS